MKQLTIHNLIKFIVIYILLHTSFISQAQFWRNDFGKNRVQYKDFRWRFISTANFDIYYYDDGYEIATLAARYAEEDFSRVTDLVGFSPYNKLKILVYNSISDLQQSNIGVKHQEFARGGQTNFVRSDVEVAFTGSKYNFKNELSLALSDILIFEMMYGGNLKELLQSSYLLNLPEWFLSGAASYIAYGWSLEMDEFVRDALTNRIKFRNPDNMEDEDARLIGHSIWNYIGEKYGQASIANILNLTRILRNEENSIQNVLGVRYKTFLQEWKAYYQKQVDDIKKDLETPDDSNLFKRNKKNLIYSKMKISPDGKRFAYTDNHRGRYKVKIHDIESGKDKTIFKAGYRIINQKIDKEIPLIEWRKTEELAILSPKKGKNYLWFYDFRKKWHKKTRRQMRQLNNVKDFDISKSGNKFVVSGERLGKSSILIYDFKRRNYKKITDDQFDDLHPKFMPDGRSVIFTSNRQPLKKDSKSRLLVETPDKFSLYWVHLDKPNELHRLTNTLSMDVRPTAINENEIIFLSDQRGIFHLYKYNRQTKITTQLTHFQQSIKDYEIVGKDLYVIMYKDGKENIFKLKNFDFDKTTFSPKTFRQEIVDARYIQALKKKREELKRLEKLREEKEKRELLEKQKQDSILQAQADSLLNIAKDTTLNGGDTVKIVNPDLDSIKKDDSNANFLEEEDDEIDTDNYQFDTFSKGKRQKFLERFKSISNDKEQVDELGKKVVDISRAIDYEPRFGVDNFITSVLIDPLRGFSLLFEAAMTDVFENHKINAGLFRITSLRDANFFTEYEFLKKRLDYRVKYERQTLSFPGQNGNDAHKYSMSTLQGSVSYPFNITSRLTLAPFYMNTRFVNMAPGFFGVEDEVDHYSGAHLEFVYDNSLITGLNMREGTRFKIRIENNIGLGNSSKSFGNVIIDFRNYKKLHKSLILATRVSFGQFFGNAKKNYLLGGMDNWLLNKEKDHGNDPDNPRSVNLEQNNVDQLFNKYVTPLRGFEYNKWYGEKYFLFNAELRFPLFKFFSRKTINSNFFRNLQFVAFTDIGSTWTGISPFKKENSLNTEIIQNEGSQFTARVSNFKNPFLVGYGAGARTMFLGYYTKFDVAWGLENYQTRPDIMYHFTIGHDF